MSSNSSTGQIIGYVVGAVVGYFTGGVGWALVGDVLAGAAAGGAIGGMLDPPPGPQIFGPRLNDLSQQGASYGATIPRIYGSVAMAGNIFWIENNKLKEVSNTEDSGGKGGGGGSEVTTYTYYATFALGLCEGPIAGIRRIWVGGKLIYDAGSNDIGTVAASNDAADGFTVYTGSETQSPDPRMQATLGVANTPAYRGLAYIVFEDFDLTDYGNTLLGSQIKVEVLSVQSLSNHAVAYETPFTTTHSNTEFPARTYNISIDRIRYAVPQWDNLYPSTSSYLLYDVYADGTVVQESEVTCPGNNSPPNQYSDSGIFLYSSDQVFSSTTAFNGGNGYMCEAKGVWAGLSTLFETIHVRDTNPDPFGNFGAELSTPIVAGDKSILTDGDFIYVSGSTSTRKYDLNLNLLETGVGVSGQGGNSRLTIDRLSGALMLATDLVANGSIRKFSPDLSSTTVYASGLTVYTGGYFAHNLLVSGDIVIFGAGGNPLVNPRKILSFFFHINSVTNESVLLSDIFEAEVAKASILEPSDIDATALTDEVRGYRVTSVSAIRGALEPLQGAWPFDVIQSGYKIKAIRRGGTSSVATIWQDELGARSGGDKLEFVLRHSREMDLQLPFRVEIKHLDIGREYDIGTQYAERLNTDSINIRSIDMPIVMTADEAAQKAEVLVYLYWLERHDLAFTLPPTYTHLEPADVVTLTMADAVYEVRLVSVDYQSNGIIECAAKYNRAATYTSSAVGSEGSVVSPGTIARPGPLALVLIDCPVLKTEYDVTGFIQGASSKTSGWVGVNVFRSMDNGQNWAVTNGIPNRSVIGFARTVIASPASFGLIDKASSLNVTLYGDSTLSSVSELQMLNGSNHFAYGIDGWWEIIAAQNCVVQTDGSYVLTDLLRGRFGTEWAAGSHAVGDSVVLLNDQTMQLLVMNAGQIGSTYQYKGVPIGTSVKDAPSVDFAYMGVNLKPLSPVYLNGNRHPSTSDWTLTWLRRTRVGGEWRDLVDATLSEASESYEVDIFSSGTYTTLKRTLTSSTPTVAYTSAQQVTDFGSNQTTLYVRVYQLSATVGRGFPLQTSITR